MFTLKAAKRNIFGKGLKLARQKGEIPAVYYGKKEKSQPIFVSAKDFQKLFKEAGETSVIEIEIENEKKNALIHAVDFNPLTDLPIHADFLVVEMDKPIEATVPLVFIGESDAVKSLGGILVKVLHEVEAEALPSNIPHQLEIDISKLKTLEDKIFISDILLPAGVKILEREPDEIIALIEMPQEERPEEAAPIDFEKIEATAEKKKEEEEEESKEKEEKKKETGKKEKQK